MRLIYRFSGPVTNKVIHSQVVGTLAALRDEGVEVDLAAWCGLGHALRHLPAYREAGAVLRRRLQAPLAVRWTIDRWPWLDRRLKDRELRRAVGQAGAQKLVLQTRSADMAALMALLRRSRPALRFVYELRGDSIAEQDYRIGPRPAPERRRAVDRLSRDLAAADLVLCVSRRLAHLVAERHGVAAERLHVMPCTADENCFRRDEGERMVRRRDLGLAERDFLLVYSGSLRKGWDAPALLGAFLHANLSAEPGLQVLLLSPDHAAAAALATRLPAGRVHCRSSDHWGMPAWLSAADAGLLLREDHPLNAVASPTKAAEMLLCGLPLVISPAVGDYSEWVARAGLGVVATEHLLPAGAWSRLRGLDPAHIRQEALEQVGRGGPIRRLAARLREL
jgi:glycosyltransferase involved in cell wall biosynthesis